MTFNPSQLNPALLQAMAANQAVSANNPQAFNLNTNIGNSNGNTAGFNAFHQAYQRLQSQESAKIDQQRLGIGQQQPQPQNQNFAQPQQLTSGGQDQSARMLQMMQQAQAQGQMRGQSQGQEMNALGGVNMHSQQQGLNLQGFGDTEEARRVSLQNMLSQQLQHMQQGGPSQQQQQVSQLPQAAHLQQQANARNAQSNEALKEFVRSHPEYVAHFQEKHPNNQNAVIQELILMQQQHQALQQQQQRPPHAVTVNGMGGMGGTQSQQSKFHSSFPLPQQQQQQQPHSTLSQQQSIQHQRIPSGSFQPATQSVQGPLTGMANFDPKQFEALQQMKERQQRQGLVTPQIATSATLPLVSPQSFNPNVQPQQRAQPPQHQSQQMSLNNTQPQNQRMSTNPQLLPQPPGQAQQKIGIQEMIMSWPAEQLHKSLGTIAGRLSQAIAPTDPSRFHLLQLIAEYKRRNLPVPNDALTAASRAFGNPQFAQQLMSLEWTQLSAFAKARAEAATGRQPQQFQQQQHVQQQQQVRQQPNMPGSQNNPIEIATPNLHATPQLPTNPAFITPQQQLQQPAQINEQLLNTPAASQVRPPQDSLTHAWVQQQQQPQSQDSGGLVQAKPWAGMDFSKEAFPLSEEQFWKYLGGQHFKRPEPLPPPRIEGKQVNLYGLFNFVHKNGGSAKMATPQAWSVLAALLGFGVPDQQQGQPPRASVTIAAQIRQLYVQFLQPVEDLFYQKLYLNRQVKAQTLSLPPMQHPQPVGALGVSAQFLDAASKASDATLTDQQKRVWEDVRRHSQSSAQPGLPLPQPSTSSVPLPAATPSQVGMSASAPAQIQALRTNPGLIHQFIKNREEHMRTRFPQQFRQLLEEDKARFLVEIRQMVVAAREAQEKAPRFALMLLDRNSEDMGTITQLISMYMFIFTTLQYAEAGRFPCPPSDLAKLRDPLNASLAKLNEYYNRFTSSAEGAAYLQRTLALLDQSAIAPPEASIAPRLRVEDLKPPPSKRPKAKPSGSSPSSTVAQSPAAQGAEKPSTPLGGVGKRKRQSESDTPKQIAADNNSRDIPAALSRPALNNALGINVDADQAEISENASFFASYRALSSASGSADVPDIWMTLTNALDDCQTAQSGPGAEDALFAEFIDVSKVDGEKGPVAAYQEPTPELFRATSREDAEGESDLSPESIKTVASTTVLTKTPADTTGVGAGISTGAVKDGQDTGLAPRTGAEQGGREMVLGDSPLSVAYNGLVFRGWEDETFDFGVAAS